MPERNDALPVRATPEALGATRRESCTPAPEGHRPLHHSPRVKPPLFFFGPQPIASLGRTLSSGSCPRAPWLRLPVLSASGSSSWAKRYGRGDRISTTPRVVPS